MSHAEWGFATRARGGWKGWPRGSSRVPRDNPVDSPAERSYDDALAVSCLALALGRHAGAEEEAWTPQGKVLVQRGKDLGAVRRLVASGGFLARLASAGLVHRALADAAQRDARTGARPLLPAGPSVLADRDYLVPVAANLAADFPLPAARLVVDNLVPLDAAGQGGPA